MLLTECIKLMKVELANPKSVASDAMIVSTIMLAWSEVCCQDRQAHVLFKCSCFNQQTSKGLEKYRDHMKGIEEMVRLRGGLENIDTFLKEMILWYGSPSLTSQFPVLLPCTDAQVTAQIKWLVHRYGAPSL